MGANEDREIGTGIGSALFGTVRRRVLGLLFREYERDFYQREIVDAVDCGSGAVQRELQQLADAGLITREERGRMVFYQANRESPVFEELRGLVMKTSGLADVIREALEPDADRIEVAFIYGSMAEGTDDADSDVDVMVIGDLTRRRGALAMARAQEHLGRPVNTSYMSCSELNERLSEKEHFVSRVLDRPKIFLAGGEDELRRIARQRPDHASLAVPT